MLLAGLCASALMMGACKGGDKLPAEEISVDAASLELSSADENELSQHFVISARSGSEAETLKVLSAADLDGATYEERMIEGSTVVYTDWTASNDDASMRADRVEMIGLNQAEDGPTLDKLVLRGLSVKGYEGEADERVKTMDAEASSLVVVKPSPAMFASLADIMMARDASSDVAGETMDGLSGGEDFRAFHLEDMRATVTEEGKTGTLTLKQAIVGNDTDNEVMDLVLETINFDWAPDQDGDDKSIRVDLDGLTVMGLDVATINDAGLQTLGATQGLMSGFIAGFAPTATPPYRQIDLGKVDVASAMFDLKTDGFEADSDVKGDVTILRSVFSPLVLTLKDMSGTPVAPYMDVLRENGFAEISFKGSSTTTFDRKNDRVSFADNGSEIDEGLRMKCTYSILGLMAAEAALKASGVTPPVLDMSEDGNQDTAFEDYMNQSQAYAAAQAEANESIKLEGMNCDIQDVPGNSLVERGYKVASDVTGKPVAVLKGGATTMIALSSLTAQSEFQRDLMDTLGSGLIDFIDTPGQTMTIKMSPDEPVGLMSLAGEDGAEPNIKPLNLTVEVR